MAQTQVLPTPQNIGILENLGGTMHSDRLRRALSNPRMRRVLVSHLQFLSDSLVSVDHTSRFSISRTELMAAADALRNFEQSAPCQVLPPLAVQNPQVPDEIELRLQRESRRTIAAWIIQLDPKKTDLSLLSRLPKPKLISMYREALATHPNGRNERNVN